MSATRSSRAPRRAAARGLPACLLPLLLLVGGGLPGLSACARERPPSLVLISLDTVRQDHVSAYGYERPTTPSLDRLAERGVLFTEAFAQEVNTAPSHGSMFTGTYPHEHGCVSNAHKLDADHATLAEILLSAGFRTAGYVSGFPMRARVSALDRGFEVWDDAFQGWRRDGRIVTGRALRWLAERGADERFFLFLHLYDAHGRYEPPEGYRDLFASEEPGRSLESIPRYQRIRDEQGRVVRTLDTYVDRYDAMIRYVDDLVGRVLEAVDLDRTVVVVLSDHGETLGERAHALDHGGQLFDEQIRIPLVLAAPGLTSSRTHARVETIDLLPTLLELLELDAPGLEIPGRSLVPALRAGAQGRDRVFSAARAVSGRHADRGYRLQPPRRLLSVRSERWKLIRYPGVDDDPVELYDLAADPGEERDVAPGHPEVRDALLEELARWHEGTRARPAPELPDEVREGLEALGYLE